MFWGRGFSKQDIRVLLLRLRKGRLLLSQQHEEKQKQKQKQRQTPIEDRISAPTPCSIPKWH